MSRSEVCGGSSPWGCPKNEVVPSLALAERDLLPTGNDADKVDVIQLHKDVLLLEAHKWDVREMDLLTIGVLADALRTMQAGQEKNMGD